MNSITQSRRPLTEVQMTGSANKNEMVGKQQSGSKPLEVKSTSTNSEPSSTSSKVQKNALTKVKSGFATKKTKKAKTFVSKEVQTENGDVSMVTGEEAPLEYWKELAESRRQALEETLEENFTLHERVKELETEKAALEEIVAHANNLASMLDNFSDEENPDESGIGLGKRKAIEDSILEKDGDDDDD